MNPGTAALTRGLDVLVTLSTSDAGLGVVDLADRLGADKSQLSRSLQTLAGQGFVERDPDTLDYRLGWRLFALAARAGEARLLTMAAPVLRALVRDLGESAHLSVRQGDSVLTLLSESPMTTVHAPGRVGSLAPLATTSAGRVLVVDLGAEELAALGLGGTAAAAIAQAQAQGYAIVKEEFEPGVVAAAAPVRGTADRVVAALNVSAPRFRLDGARLDAAAVRVAEAAESLSAAFRGA